MPEIRVHFISGATGRQAGGLDGAVGDQYAGAGRDNHQAGDLVRYTTASDANGLGGHQVENDPPAPTTTEARRIRGAAGGGPGSLETPR